MVDGNRYILMAHGMLLFLVLPPSWMDVAVMSKTRQSITGKFDSTWISLPDANGDEQIKAVLHLS